MVYLGLIAIRLVGSWVLNNWFYADQVIIEYWPVYLCWVVLAFVVGAKFSLLT